MDAAPAPAGLLHHVEVWVADLARAGPRWRWLLGELGCRPHQEWPGGFSLRLGATYVVVERSPDLVGDRHDRRAPGVNHLAFHAGTRADVERVVAAAGDHGWRLLFADRHPHAGGAEHHAAYLENEDGHEVELVAAAQDR